MAKANEKRNTLKMQILDDRLDWQKQLNIDTDKVRIPYLIKMCASLLIVCRIAFQVMGLLPRDTLPNPFSTPLPHWTLTPRWPLSNSMSCNAHEWICLFSRDEIRCNCHRMTIVIVSQFETSPLSSCWGTLTTDKYDFSPISIYSFQKT